MSDLERAALWGTVVYIFGDCFFRFMGILRELEAQKRIAQLEQWDGENHRQIAALHKRLDNLEYKIGEMKQ